jgi:hypothetical protein
VYAHFGRGRGGFLSIYIVRASRLQTGAVLVSAKLGGDASTLLPTGVFGDLLLSRRPAPLSSSSRPITPAGSSGRRLSTNVYYFSKAVPSSRLVVVM